MYPFLKKISTKKKTVAFVLSLMLLMTILEPQPVQAEGGIKQQLLKPIALILNLRIRIVRCRPLADVM